MSKRFAAWVVLFSLEFLSLGYLTCTASPSQSLQVLPLLGAASQPDIRAFKLDLPPKNDARLFFTQYGELPPRSVNFLAAKEATEGYFPSSHAVSILFSIVLAPKVSSYIFQSVLNL